MIKFFRTIRKKLLSENKVMRYLIYALGEIILVVIGILIALAINNKNEEKKTKKFEYQILKDIETNIDGNLWQMEMGLDCGRKGIRSVDIIFQHLNEKTPYHDSLDVHFSQSLKWCNPVINNAGYESLKTYGRNLISNDSIRIALNIYDTGWLEVLAQRQEDYFYTTAAPLLTGLFDKVAMRSKMKPFNYNKLSTSREYISILNTSKANREDQLKYYGFWYEDLKELQLMIENELIKNKAL